MGQERNPFQVYILGLCVMTGITALTPTPTSSSVARVLDPPHLHIWGGMLAFGAVLSLLGMFWWGDARNGLVTKRLGLITLFIPCITYGIAILVVQGFPGGLTIALSLVGFAAACAIQARRVHRRIKTIIKLTERSE